MQPRLEKLLEDSNLDGIGQVDGDGHERDDDNGQTEIEMNKF